MRWTDKASGIAALLGCLLLLSAPAQEKKLSIYSPQTAYSVAVLEREGRDYVGLVDVLEPLGTFSAKVDGDRCRVRFTPAAARSEIEAQFTLGKAGAKVRGKDFELASRFLIENGRGLVPLHSLPALLTRFFETPIEFHESGRRLFVGSTAVRYNAELKKAPARLVLSFSAPVNPFVATEPGRLRMVFTREPLLAAPAGAQSFDDRTITGLAFSENNGAAELAVSGSAPLLAGFSDGGRTITVTAAPQPAQAAPPPVEVPAQPSGQQPAAPAPQARVLVVIDPGHGGSESGAALGDLEEKDFNLALARRLREELETRGIHSLLLREGDTALSLEQRAVLANGAHAALYLGVHAAPNGAGVRVFTSDLPPAPSKAGTLLPWETAQSAYLEASSAIAKAVTAELGKRQIAAVSLVAPVRPLNNVAAAAVALEVAPPESDPQGLASPVYQQTICNAIAGALASLRARLEVAR